VQNQGKWSGHPFWEVTLIREEGAAKTASYSHRDLRMAWEGALHIAENHDAALMRGYMTSPIYQGPP
jgi:hypothetical protein